MHIQMKMDQFAYDNRWFFGVRVASYVDIARDVPAGLHETQHAVNHTLQAAMSLAK